MKGVRRHGCHPRESPSFLKATLPTCILSRTESSPTRSKVLPLRHGDWVPRIMQAGPGQKVPKPPRAVRATAQRLQAFLHYRPDQRVKGRTAMQSACNRTKGAHPFDFDASNMEAQAHTSCNRRAGYYVRETAPPLAPVPRLLDCGTGAATQGDPAHDPTVPTEHIGHGPVSHGRRRDGRYGQKWAGSNGDGRRAEAAVKSSASSRPSWDSERTLSHGVKTTRPCSVPRTARARATAAPRTTHPVALTLRQDRRHLWQAKQATLHLRHNDRVKKGAPRRSISYPFPLPLSLSCHRDRERGYSERDPSP
jgi:hypothetical protein